MKRTTSFILIILALLFSHFVILNFNLNGGFEPKGIKIQLFNLIQLAPNTSRHTTLTSSVIGYILFAVFLIANYNRAKASNPNLVFVTLSLSIISVLFELRSIILDINNSYTGQRLGIGLVLFVMCFIIYNAIYKGEKQTPL